MIFLLYYPTLFEKASHTSFGPVHGSHVRQFYLILFINVVQFGHWKNSIRESLVTTKCQVFSAMNRHKNNIFVLRPHTFRLHRLQKFCVNWMSWSIEFQKYCWFFFIKEKVKYLLFTLKLNNFVVVINVIFFLEISVS